MGKDSLFKKIMLELLKIHLEKKEPQLLFHLYTKTESKCIINLNVNTKIVTLLEENIGEILMTLN